MITDTNMIVAYYAGALIVFGALAGLAFFLTRGVEPLAQLIALPALLLGAVASGVLWPLTVGMALAFFALAIVFRIHKVGEIRLLRGALAEVDGRTESTQND